MAVNFRRFFLISSLTIIGSFIVASLGLYLLDRDIDSRIAEIITDRGLINQRSQILETLAQLTREADEAEPLFAQMNALLPTRDQLLDFPRWLESQARLRGTATNFSFDGAQVEPGGGSAGVAPFLLSVEGDFQNILGFLRDLEVNPQKFIVDIGTFDLGRRPTGYFISAKGRVFFK